MSATVGDLVFVSVDSGLIDMRLARVSEIEALQGMARLTREVRADLGATDDSPTIARALDLDGGSTAATIARRLRARGEDDLASLIPERRQGDLLTLDVTGGRFDSVPGRG